MDFRKKTLALSSGFLFLLLFAANIWALEITDLQCSDGRAVELAEDGMKVGDTYSTDRAYTLIEVPDKYKDLQWIKIATDSKSVEDLQISFDIDSPAYIYIAWLDVFKAAMDGLEWTKEYEDTGDDIKVFTTSEHPVSLYRSKQIVGPGTVTTYNSDMSSYFILIEKALAAVESAGKLVTTWAKIRTR